MFNNGFMMPGIGPKYFLCVLCNKRTKPGERRCLNISIKKYLQKHFMLETKPSDIICNKCRQGYYKTECKGSSHRASINKNNEEQNAPPAPQKTTSVSSPPSVMLPIQSTAKSHSYCFICRKPGNKLVVVSADARFKAFLRNEIIIPSGSRCCPGHLADGNFTVGSMDILKSTNNSVLLSRSSILELLKKLRVLALHNEQRRIDFDSDQALSLTDYFNMTGITKENFDELCPYVSEYVRNTPSRSTRTSLGIYLFKLRAGISNKVLSTIFNISKSSLRRGICSVRKALMQTFVPRHLGLSHITRQEVISNHTRTLAQTLFGDVTNSQVILVLDGTYIYIQKSGNFQFQRRTFSLHKGRPLVKPMIVTSTTGYFITVVGPYLSDSKNNDANILKHMMLRNIDDIKNWIDEGDIFIVDRGFRDSVEMLNDMGIKAEMPSFLPKGQKQMTTDEANTSRLVTKVRWVVESANARIKRWTYLNHVLPTSQVPYIGDDVRIVCSICNKFLPPLSTDGEDDLALGARMLYLSKQINALKERVESENLERKRAVWKELDSNTFNFPLIDETELRNITCGSYQIKMCPTYVQEHAVNGNFELFVHAEDENLIRIKIQSRHISSKQYLIWIEYNPVSVTAWYCKCKAGARVVGVCAHIASVLWYLGYARHNPTLKYGVRNWSEFVSDAKDIPETIDSSSDSEDNLVEE